MHGWKNPKRHACMSVGQSIFQPIHVASLAILIALLYNKSGITGTELLKDIQQYLAIGG
jgi:hypothetical protein